MGAVDKITQALQFMIPTFAKSDGEIESKIIDVVGAYADTEKIEHDRTSSIIQDALANQKVTRIEYYRRKSAEFQIGDELLIDPVNFGGYYETINEENRIIKQAYVAGTHPAYQLLVNTIGDDGHLRPLTETELASFVTYFSAFQPIGLDISINSVDVAKISDPGISLHVRAGSDAGQVADDANAALIAHEATFRTINAVTLTEIVDVLQRVPGVIAVGFGNPVATEIGLDGEEHTVYPVNGVFQLTNGAFTFTTEITTDHIKVIQ